MCSCSVVSDSATPWTAAHKASLSITISQKLLKLMSIESMMPSHPLLPPSPAFCLSQHQSLFLMNQLFAPGGQSIGVSTSASVLPMSILDWFPLGLTGLISLQSKGQTLKSLLQCHSSKTSIFWCSAFFMVQLSYPSMTIGKPIALPRQTLLAKSCLCFLIYCLGLSLEKAMAPHSSTLPGKSHGWRNLVGCSPWGC